MTWEPTEVTFCVRGAVSPLLANLFLHYVFDLWMRRTYPGVPFERYADDAIVHCRTEAQAQTVLGAIRGRFEQCGLTLHPTKTRIVYCKDSNRSRAFEHVAFDFLGFTFQPRRARNRQGENFSSFLPAMSTKAATHVRQTIREWRLASTKNHYALEDLPKLVDPVVRGGCTTTAGITGLSVCTRSSISTRPSRSGCNGNTSGFATGRGRPGTGCDVSRVGTPNSLPCGRWG